MNSASSDSLWRGYEYYKGRKVISIEQVSEDEFEGTVQGSGDQCYEVFINIAHPRKSHCNCPHANGRRIICKHQIALFFTAFPLEAEKYYKGFSEYAAEEERRQIEIDRKLITYIKSLSKKELQETLYEVLSNGSECVYNHFVSEHLDWD